MGKSVEFNYPNYGPQFYFGDSRNNYPIVKSYFHHTLTQMDQAPFYNLYISLLLYPLFFHLYIDQSPVLDQGFLIFEKHLDFEIYLLPAVLKNPIFCLM